MGMILPNTEKSLFPSRRRGEAAANCSKGRMKKLWKVSVCSRGTMKRLQDSRRHSSPVILPSIVLPPEDEGSEGPESTEEEEDDNPGSRTSSNSNVWEALRQRISEKSGARQLNALMSQVRLKRRKQLRHMSVDFSAGCSSPPGNPAGILKNTPSNSNAYLNAIINHHAERRKSVSFCETDSVKIFSRQPNTASEHEEESDNFAESDEDNLREPDQCRKQLIPLFVFPNKKPNFTNLVRKKVVILEYMDIQQNGCTDVDGISVIGIIRVNITRLRALETQDQRKNGQQVIVGADYSLDDWKTTTSTKSFKVPSGYIRPHPSLSDINCVFMRFCIDLDELDVGATLSVKLWCADKGSRGLRSEDTNDGSFYKLKCTSKLNQWAAEAAKQLKNYAPIVRYNKNFYAKSK